MNYIQCRLNYLCNRVIYIYISTIFIVNNKSLKWSKNTYVLKSSYFSGFPQRISNSSRVSRTRRKCLPAGGHLRLWPVLHHLWPDEAEQPLPDLVIRFHQIVPEVAGKSVARRNVIRSKDQRVETNVARPGKIILNQFCLQIDLICGHDSSSFIKKLDLTFRLLVVIYLLCSLMLKRKWLIFWP